MSSPSNSPPESVLTPVNVSYTALVATLVLLLAVSSAIVIRSLVLRRRHQRLVEEAIRAGTWMPHNFNSSRRRRDIGQKPTLWETWVHPNNDDSETEENEKRNWDDIMPVYAAYVHPRAPSPQGSTPSSAENPVEVVSRSPPRFIRPFTRRRSPTVSQDTVSPETGQTPPSLPSSSPTAMPAAVRVAVLIAMPDASPKHHGDESEPPVVEIGVVEVNMKDDEIETPGHVSS